MNTLKVYILPFGTLDIPESLLYGDDFPSDKIAISPMYGVVIDHPNGKILFDTGLILDEGPVGIDIAHFTEEDIIVNRFKSIGISMDEVKYVVISHLHSDHCGNLHRFENAEIYVNKADFVQTLVNYGLNTPKIMSQEYVETWVRHKPQWRLVESKETELLSGVTMYSFGAGHTYGMLMLKVKTKNAGTIFLVSDLIYSQELCNKHKLPGIVYDEAGYYEAVAEIKEMAKKENASIWFGHDIKQLRTLKIAPEYYE